MRLNYYKNVDLINHWLIFLFIFIDSIASQHGYRIPPSFTDLPPREIIHTADQKLLIPCDATGYPRPSFEWYMNGERLLLSRPERPNDNDGRSQQEALGAHNRDYDELHLWDFTDLFASGRLRAGWLYCVAHNPVGRAISPPLQFHVAHIDTFAPCKSTTITLEEKPFVKLNCSVPKSTPSATVRWMYRTTDGSIGFLKENRTFSIDDEGNLLVANSGFPMSSQLTVFCSASNNLLRTIRTGCDYTVRKAQRRFKLPGNPLLMARSPEQQTRLLNDTVNLRCLISQSPGTEIRWRWQATKHQPVIELREGDWTNSPSKVPVQVKNEGTLLTINRIIFENVGIYSCYLHGSAASVSADFQVSVESIPMLEEVPMDTTVAIQGTAKLRCEPTSLTRPTATVTWHINGEPVERHFDGVRKRLIGNTVFLSELGMQDSAVFQCNISNSHGFQFVNAYVNIWSSPPAILRGPQDDAKNDLVVAEGQEMRLQCRVLSAPPAQIFWAKDGNSVVDIQGNQTRAMTDGSLYFRDIALSDSGAYKCTASNSFGSSSKTSRLVVRRRTQIVSGPILVGKSAQQNDRTVFTTHIGSDVTLFCQAEADIAEISGLRMKWFWLPFEDNATHAGAYQGLPSERFRSVQRHVSHSSIESSLRLADTLPAHSGRFQCSAVSSVDKASKAITLVVEGPPEAPPFLHIDCSWSSKRGSVLLTWIPASDNNSPLTGVIIEYAVGYHRPLLESKSNPEHSDIAFASLEASILRNEWLTMKAKFREETFPLPDAEALVNLTSGTALVPIYPDVAYQFRVRLVNGVGVSGPSPVVPGLDAEVRRRCLLPPTPPTVRPELVKIFGNVPHTLSVAWEPISPIQHGGPGLQYHITIKCMNCDHQIGGSVITEKFLASWNVTRIVFSKFPIYASFSHYEMPVETFKHYQVNIRTSNALGYSLLAPLVDTGWSAETPPTVRPRNLRAVRVETSEVELEWQWARSPLDSAGTINGFFVGFRIEWCPEEKPPELCDRYKVNQDIILSEPSEEMHSNLRLKSTNLFPSMHKYRNNSGATEFRDVRKPSKRSHFSQHTRGVLRDLPGLSRIRVWISVLNIQYQGPKSEIIPVHTMEGVPCAVGEFTNSFSGVNYVEVAWTKPTQTNGILLGYIIDVIAPITENKAEHSLYQTKISDPDQMSARLAGLVIGSSYKLVITGLTAAGVGEPKELQVATANQRSGKSTAEFRVSQVNGSKTTLNVSLVNPSDSINLANDDQRLMPALQMDSQVPSTMSGVMAFVVQFKRPQDDQWEETEKEAVNEWKVVGNLVPGEEYDMRVVLARSPTASYVSPTRVLRVPRPEEYGIGLTENLLGSSKRSPPPSRGHSPLELSLILKIFIPVAALLLLFTILLTGVCCLRSGSQRRFTTPRQTSVQRCRESSIVLKKENKYNERTEKETLMVLHNGRAGAPNSTSNEQNLQGKRPIQDWFENSTSYAHQTSIHNHNCLGTHRSPNALRSAVVVISPDPASLSYAPTRCLSPSFTLAPPMATATAAWQPSTTSYTLPRCPGDCHHT